MKKLHQGLILSAVLVAAYDMFEIYMGGEGKFYIALAINLFVFTASVSFLYGEDKLLRNVYWLSTFGAIISTLLLYS
jgi:hypothetical protein